MFPVAADIAQRAQAIHLSPADLTRYSRHVLLPELGIEGQKRLKASRVLIVGVGGLGSPAALYLAAAGVGTLGLCDADRIDLSNLQRQVLYSSAEVGGAKVAVAATRLSAINPDLIVESHDAMFAPDNALGLVSKYDLVIDGSDNFQTRYLVTDACVLAGKPYVYGSIMRFAGQASVFYPPYGPCYRCLFPRPPAPGSVPNCAEGGVLGVLPGVIGSVQATEAIKLVVGIGEPLLGRILTYDALSMRWSELSLAPDHGCPLCGDHPTISAIGTTEGASCQLPDMPNDAFEISVHDFHAMRLAEVPHELIDIRTEAEVAICRLSGSVHIPLSELVRRHTDLADNRPLVIHCKGGVRSAQAVNLLRSQGYTNAMSLRGGIMAWIDAYDPTLARY